MTRQELLAKGFSEELLDRAVKKYADLKIQAMMFDMDIDIETWSLRPKSTYKEPFWLTRWKEKVNEGDTKHDWGE